MNPCSVFICVLHEKIYFSLKKMIYIIVKDCCKYCITEMEIALVTEQYESRQSLFLQVYNKEEQVVLTFYIAVLSLFYLGTMYYSNF